jgi:hypothetical protein
LPPTSPLCAYRYIVRGRTFCALAIQESRYTLSEVIPATCAQCPLPGLLAAHACGRMNLGLEISVFGGRQNVEMGYSKNYAMSTSSGTPLATKRA